MSKSYGNERIKDDKVCVPRTYLGALLSPWQRGPVNRSTNIPPAAAVPWLPLFQAVLMPTQHILG